MREGETGGGSFIQIFVNQVWYRKVVVVRG